MRDRGNVTKIVVGKTDQPWLKRFLFGTVVAELLENSGDIDIYVVARQIKSARVAFAFAASDEAGQLAPLCCDERDRCPLQRACALGYRIE